jgi:hypothetical protein
MLHYLQRQSNIQSKLPKELDPFSPTVYNFYTVRFKTTLAKSGTSLIERQRQ